MKSEGYKAPLVFLTTPPVLISRTLPERATASRAPRQAVPVPWRLLAEPAAVAVVLLDDVEMPDDIGRASRAISPIRS